MQYFIKKAITSRLLFREEKEINEKDIKNCINLSLNIIY